MVIEAGAAAAMAAPVPRVGDRPELRPLAVQVAQRRRWLLAQLLVK